MSGLGNRTAILTLARLASYGLQLTRSPIFLVRLLTVEDFRTLSRVPAIRLHSPGLRSVYSINDSAC